ncbi:FkbM family methyltransferase [Streptomyces sp. E11-3]|uniref:FkbM family methyltransferase n=1 Tax=Streptomyces sp. E11-3 TaxID=3110112 RepID=UPI00397F625D
MSTGTVLGTRERPGPGAVVAYGAADATVAYPVADAATEPEIAAILWSRLEPGDTFVDVGAGTGRHAVLGARMTGASGHVVAVEPEPRRHQLLTARLERHAPGTYAAPAVAALDRNGAVELRLGGAPVRRPAVRLDDLLAGVPGITLVRIDAAGAEHRVIRGMEHVIRCQRPAVVTEFVPEAIVAAGADPDRILDRYRALDLDVERVTSGPGGRCTLLLLPR